MPMATTPFPCRAARIPWKGRGAVRRLLSFLTLTVGACSDAGAQTPLPDPLVARDGSVVATASDWEHVRKPELRELFEQFMFGRYPAKPERVVGRTLFNDPHAFAGQGTLREIELTVGPPAWPKIYLLIAAPNADHPVACFVGPNFGGNHLRTDDERVRLPTSWMPEGYLGVVDHRATEAGRGKQAESWDIWPLEDAVKRGYAIVTFYCGDVQPDKPDMLGGIPEFAAPPSDKPDPDTPGAIMWWAWGIHRAVDYLVTDPSIDPKRIAVVGHSRLGKTALLAGAFDDRIALTIPHQAGCGGSGPSRHDDPKAETVAIITKKFPHWFSSKFASHGADPAKLPFDQNCLVALCAPRPVLFTSASEDVWSNPSGQFEVLKAATPVYELLGVEGLAAESWPSPGDPLVASRLGYWIRPGKHSLLPEDWKVFMDFADRWL
jgi:hypothetical protein